jgi:putative pyoverdin transport system ATP-binding/permease protein
MRLLVFIGHRSWQLGLGALASGTASGLCAASLIALINRALNRPDSWGVALAWGFGGLVAMRIISAGAAQVLANHFSQRVLADISRDLSRRLLAVPLPQLEAIGPSRILVTLIDDAAVIAWTIHGAPGLAINLAILAGCAAYVAWLSWPVFLAVSAFVAVGTSTFLLLLRPAQRHWGEVWRHRERLIGHLRSLIDGVKELKLHAARRQAFLSGSVGEALEAVRRASVRGTVRQALASAWSQSLFFALLGALLFGVPSMREGSSETLTGYLLVAIYMIGPLWFVIEAWPNVARGSLAAERLMELTSRLEAELPSATPARPNLEWERLELKGVVFAYPPDSAGRAFQLGPLDFALRPGEIVFVAGGNGSGKSTFAKVLTGLYPLQAGEIRLDGCLVEDPSREWYHAHFSAIFADFHLFDHLLGLAGPDLDAQARAGLARLELEGAVRVDGGVFSSTALSSGQRKRLALLTALLEDRPIYVLDEWAADQDPHYREIFYTALLPELRSRGKAVVVISHDDRYYGLGDRTLRLAYGQVAP